MNTATFSLTQEQVKMIDKLTTSYGFANRSEFMRAVLRLLKTEPDLVKAAATHPFVSPKTKSVKKIVSDFTKSNKYSAEFIRDLETGLSESDYFTK